MPITGQDFHSAAAGTYTVICQHIGYAAKEKAITITTQDQEITFVLSEQKLVLKEVVIKNTDEDPAYAIIRAAIKSGKNIINRLAHLPATCIQRI